MSKLNVFYSVLILFSLSMPVGSVSANDNLGRLFFNAAEREQLDHLRKVKPTATTTKPAVTAEPEPETKTNATGYIIDPSGQTHAWRDGEFISTDQVEEEPQASSSQIRIVRHTSPDLASELTNDQQDVDASNGNDLR